MLRVLHITHSLGFGGIESQLVTLAATKGLRHRHEFCAIATGGDAERAIAASGKAVHVLAIDPWRSPLKAARRLARLIGKQRPDVVHCHGLEANVWGLPAAWWSRVRVRIGEEIGIWDRALSARLTVKTAYRLASCIVATSDAVRAFLLDSGAAPDRKISTLYNPVRFSALTTKPRQTGERLRVGCVGRLHHVKNPLGLVRAIALVREAGLNVEAWFLGDGPQRSEVEALVDELGIGDRVRLCGYLENPSEVLATCHLYVQPSPAEGFGIAMVEAMGCALPVIASRSGAAPEIVADGVHGWLIDSVEPVTMAEAIGTAAALEPDRLWAMGSKARRSVQDRFSPEIYRNKLEDLYDRLS